MGDNPKRPPTTNLNLITMCTAGVKALTVNKAKPDWENICDKSIYLTCSLECRRWKIPDFITPQNLRDEQLTSTTK